MIIIFQSDIETGSEQGSATEPLENSNPENAYHWETGGS